MGLLHLSLDFVQHLLHPPQLEWAQTAKWGLLESHSVREVPPHSDPLARVMVVAQRCDGDPG